MKKVYLVLLCCLTLAGCSQYSVGWLSHPQSSYPVNDNDMYLNPTNRNVQVEKSSGVQTNSSAASETVWFWQKEFWRN